MRVLGYSSEVRKGVEEEFKFGLLLPATALVLWSDIERLLTAHPPQRGCELFATNEDILRSVVDTSAFVWVGVSGEVIELVMICCFRDYPLTKTMEVFYVGGKRLARAFTFWKKVEEWAAACGATHIEARMSRAMVRFYRSMNVEPTAIYYRKALVGFAN